MLLVRLICLRNIHTCLSSNLTCETPVTRLRLYVLKSGRHSSSAVVEANNLEGNASMSVIRCVESCQLQAVFSIEVIKKKLAKLEKKKTERKKAGGPSRFPYKQSRGTGGPYPFPPTKADRGPGSSFGLGFQNPVSQSYHYAVHAGYEI